MNARHILAKFKRVFLTQNKPPTLGRWNIHNHRKTKLKVKYANEDNCGISGSKPESTKTNLSPHDNQYIYMMGYESIHD